MITPSGQTDYACRLVLSLATLPPETRVTAQEIAKRRVIPRARVRGIITQLGKAKLLMTTRGMGGGIALARHPSPIGLRDVTQAMEGTPALNACVTNLHACPLMKVCPVHEAWTDAHAHLVAQLHQATFDKQAQRVRVLELTNSS